VPQPAKIGGKHLAQIRAPSQAGCCLLSHRLKQQKYTFQSLWDCHRLLLSDHHGPVGDGQSKCLCEKVRQVDTSLRDCTALSSSNPNRAGRT
jgi:hypothetical protein